MNGSDLIRQLMDRGLAGPHASAKGGDLLNQIMNSGAAGGVFGGALAGSLTSLLTGKRGKKLTKSAVKIGGLAAIGGLAYAAYKRYQQQSEANTAGAPAPRPQVPVSPEESQADSSFLPSAADTAARDALGLALVRAMIAAAKSDGHIDRQEQQRIFDQINKLDLSSDDKAFLLEELGKPLDIDAIVKLAVSPEVATEIYTASLVAVDADTPAEEAYLQMLAARLGLEPGLVEQIHETVDTAAREAEASR